MSDDLVTAEHLIRGLRENLGGTTLGPHLGVLLTEYDRRGRRVAQLAAERERAEADLAQARGVVEAAKAYVAAKASGYCRTEDDVRERRELFGRLARSVSPDRQELREEDLRFEHFDVPDQSVIDESGRGVRLTHTPSGVAVSSGAERTQLQNMAQCVELLRRELAARSVSPDHTGEN